MNGMEIALLVAGAVIFILSFLIPAKKEEVSASTKQESAQQIKDMISKEMESARGKVEDIVDETVTYAMEKAERSMERISNEKIMAVNEYSDTVLEDISKNHKEVLFLYDMLNDKHDTLKETVNEAEKSVKAAVDDAKDVVADVKIVVEDVKKSEPVEFEPFVPPVVTVEPKKETKKKVTTKTATTKVGTKATTTKASTTKSGSKGKSKSEEINELKVQFTKENEGGRINSNEKILTLHKDGKSNMAIAKELGLGLGEVKLVIDLYEGM